MNAEDKRALILEWLKDYCKYPNDRWKGDEPPAGIKLAMEELFQMSNIDMAKQSESLGDYSVTYSIATNWEKLPPFIRMKVNTYRSVF